MNDRSQAGSGWNEGRIELMINRIGNTTDALGVNEPMKDLTSDGRGINVSAKFFLAFTTSKKQAIRTIFKRHFMT